MAASNVTAGSGSPLALSCLVIATNQNRLRFARHWLPTIEPIATPTATPIIRPESLLEQTIIHECAKQPATKESGSFYAGASRVTFKRFASLNFMVVSTQSENQYAMLAFIQAFVEILSKYFGSFSEYHVIFHLEKIHLVLDEMVTAGFVVETNRDLILPTFAQLERNVMPAYT
ncbi:hypothetical protein BATDEDRAFT_23872 [Batrachochytrium dendrobatidis JAM81]|uniref:AP complex mu/sigma subunit domain-containing protein n=2 Tax=Batrachochytrium dendrobatidis TaxID=109871 RepID=F4NZI3_BATDJ|nr:uncharacterized protein BATDEDRAFT_23872 [Batrachochytrium dendrobatidis JAM81]EGF81447.1 hypothetical protein BATDEDRAFT_23872 [Batrachochytrium dendrobatidis JAM81]OAJ38466.1 hypothetical protein BDEG_22390 [Batrachochytrium dendrobatidis JEL423]|eukprot:XP_006677861.1 hypothetical protein BATDEDRAFT_23872 [Batrachochytrium dendrobatidis JAM81]